VSLPVPRRGYTRSNPDLVLSLIKDTCKLAREYASAEVRPGTLGDAASNYACTNPQTTIDGIVS
jgi:hypothetical protein